MKKLGLLVTPLLTVSFLTNCNSPSKEYTVFFVSNGGTLVTEQKVKENDRAIKPDNPTKNGYTFEKWCTDEALTNEYDFSSLVTSNFILYAKWSDAITYSITYHMPDGATQSNPTSYTVESEDITLSNATIDKKGYEEECDGWHIGSATGTPITTIPKGSTGNLDLYTSATIITYTIKYHMPKDATQSNPTSYTVESEDIVLDNATKEGYKFDGWHIGSAGGASISTIPKGSTGNLDLYTSETVIDYKITYNNLGGSTTDNPEGYTINSNTITLKDPTDHGYTFTGWHIGSTAGTPITTIPKGSTGNLDLYASWDSTPTTYTITYKNVVESEHSSDPESYTVETDTITLSTPTRDANWTFGGWYTELDFKNKIESIPKGSYGDLTLYAKMTYNKTLEQCSWAEIKTISEKGGGRATFGAPGEQTKKVELNGNEYQVRIVGYDYDELSTSTNDNPQYAGITFEFVSTIKNFTTYWNNKDGDNSTSYDFVNKSNLNDCLQPEGTVYEMIAGVSDGSGKLIDVIKTVNKKIDIHPDNVWIEGNYKTKLFPLSYDEIGGDEEAGSDNAYEYYKVNYQQRRIKEPDYWLRSPVTKFSNRAWEVLDRGLLYNGFGYYVYNCAYLVAPAFCI